ncbi:hypothetical protein QEN19_003680 [Hanseniaspora menglaensis]
MLKNSSLIAKRGIKFVPKYKKKFNDQIPVYKPIETKIPSERGQDIFNLYIDKKINQLDPSGWKTKAIETIKVPTAVQYKKFIEENDDKDASKLIVEGKYETTSMQLFNKENNPVLDSWKFFPYTQKEFFTNIQATQSPVKNFPLPLRLGDVVRLRLKTSLNSEPEMFGQVFNINAKKMDSTIFIRGKNGDVFTEAKIPVYLPDLISLEIIDRVVDEPTLDWNTRKTGDSDDALDLSALAEQFKKDELKRRVARMKAYKEKQAKTN